MLLPRAKDENPDYMEIKGHAGNVIFRHAFAAVVGLLYHTVSSICTGVGI